MIYLLMYYWTGIIYCILELTVFEYGPIARWFDNRVNIAFRKFGLNVEKDRELNNCDILKGVFLWPLYVIAIIICIILGKED